MFYTYDHMIKMNYVSADWSLGGNLWHVSITGAMGMTDIYVNQHVSPDSISWPTVTHPNFKIGRRPYDSFLKSKLENYVVNSSPPRYPQVTVHPRPVR